MALQKSLTQPFAKNRLSIGSGWRAFFAPYNISLGSAVADTSQGPKILDLMVAGPVNDDNLPAGWFDLGWIKDLARTPQSKVGLVRSGYRGAVRALYSAMAGEQVEFKFREKSRMATKVATGRQVINLIANSVASTEGPVSSTGASAYTMSSYSSSTPSITLGGGDGANFAANDLIVADLDYNGTDYGLIGENATPVFQGEVVDTDYIRKTSDFVARVVEVSTDTLILDKPFAGGGSANPGPGNTEPQAGSKVQKIRGWASREGGTYVTEWSAMFIMDTVDLGQYIYYVPHVAPSQYRGMTPWALEDPGTTDLQGYELSTVLNCLAFDDPLDGQTVVAYEAYYPPLGASPSH